MIASPPPPCCRVHFQAIERRTRGLYLLLLARGGVRKAALGWLARALTRVWSFAE